MYENLSNLVYLFNQLLSFNINELYSLSIATSDAVLLPVNARCQRKASKSKSRRLNKEIVIIAITTKSSTLTYFFQQLNNVVMDVTNE